jgi:hypothetical protein
MAYSVNRIGGLKKSEHRAIAILYCDHDARVDDGKIFAQLDDKRERELRTRFDLWIDGGAQKNYFHGWPSDSGYKYCFVFKWKKARQNHRLYGFLYHPTPQSNARFLLCVLVSHAIKARWETDPRELDMANKLRPLPEIREAISKAFPERKITRTTWLNRPSTGQSGKSMTFCIG